MKLLIVGGDAAGMTVASHVRRELPDAEVVVIERGHYTSYSACGIPFYVGGEIETPQRLVVRSPEEHRDRGITVHMRTEALSVDSIGKTVRVRDLDCEDERDERYDALLLATGAHPVTQGIKGLAEHGFVVHTLDEGVALRRRLEEHDEIHRVVVVGAGYIGIEIAEALVRRGIDTTIVDRSRQVFRALDPDMAEHVQKVLTDFGVRLRLGETLMEITARHVTTDTQEYPADTVVVALGGKPNLAVAKTAGCAVGTSGGLVVDGQMRTTVPGIWAAGDCVESVDLVGGLRRNVQLGTHANKQGKIAAISLVDALQGGTGDVEAAFPGVVGTAVTKVCQWEIARVGLLESDARELGIDYAVTTFDTTARAGYMPDAGVVHVKMMAEAGTGRVLGCQLVGTGNVAKRIDVAAMWCQLGVTVQQAQFLDLSYAPPFGGVWDLLQVAARKLVGKLGLHPQL